MQQVGLMNDEERFGQVADERLDDIVATAPGGTPSS